MSKELTGKQEAFCKAIGIEGLSQTQAYRKAYNCQNMKPETVNAKAYELAQQGHITDRISELKYKTEKKAIDTFIKTKNDLLKDFQRLVDRIDENEELRDKARGIREMRECFKEQGKLCGFYEQVKIEVSQNQNNNNYADVDVPKRMGRDEWEVRQKEKLNNGK